VENGGDSRSPGEAQPAGSGASGIGEDDTYHHASDNAPVHSLHDEEVLSEGRASQYWRANINLLLKLLAIWFVVSLGFGVLLADYLNQFMLFGYPLGFWWAQQGSIYVFVALIFIYVTRIRQIERRFGVDDDE
jgi:putative solute:sodium symporter small subunit